MAAGDGPGEETSSLIPGQSPRQRGLLARGRDSRFEPVVSSTLSTVNFALPQVVFADPTAWPGTGDAAFAAANAYIAGALGLPLRDVRLSYTHTNVDFASKESQLALVSLPGGRPGFTSADVDAAKAQLGKEFGWVATTRDFFTNLKSPFSESATQRFVDVKTLADDIQQALDAPSGDAEATSIVGAVLSGATVAARLSGNAEAFAAFSVISTAFAMASKQANTATGNPVDIVQTSADDLGQGLSDAFTTALDTCDLFETLVLSDYGKLGQVASRATSDPGWVWTPTTTDAVARVLDAGVRQEVYSGLFPVAYQAYVLQGFAGLTDAADIACGYILGTPFPKLATSSQWSETYPAGSSVTGSRVWALGRLPSGSVAPDFLSLALPPASLTGPMFADPGDSSGSAIDASTESLGLYAPWFSTRNYDVSKTWPSETSTGSVVTPNLGPNITRTSTPPKYPKYVFDQCIYVP